MRPHSRLTSRQSKRFVERKNNRTAITVFLTVFCLALWIYCFSTLTYLNVFTINNFAVNGVEPSVAQNIQNLAARDIEGSYLGLFSKSNSFIYPRQTILASIQASLPSIRSLKVNRQDLRSLRITIIEKDPSAIICATLPDFSENILTIDDSHNCYYADRSGYIFDEAVLSASTTYNHYYFPMLADNMTSGTIIGLYATSTAEFVALQNFYDGLKRAGFNISGILAKENGEYELYADNTVIYFNNQRPFDEQSSNLISFWTKTIKNSSGSGINAFEYIDIRFGSNVFYREIK